MIWLALISYHFLASKSLLHRIGNCRQREGFVDYTNEIKTSHKKEVLGWLKMRIFWKKCPPQIEMQRNWSSLAVPLSFWANLP